MATKGGKARAATTDAAPAKPATLTYVIECAKTFPADDQAAIDAWLSACRATTRTERPDAGEGVVTSDDTTINVGADPGQNGSWPAVPGTHVVIRWEFVEE
jgi:hypothetical protein